MMKIYIVLVLCISISSIANAEPSKKILDFIAKLEVAVQDGNPVAEFHLGNIYLDGLEGVKKDPKKGFNYLLESAKHGYVKAQYNVAASYKLGQGTPQNTEKALYWYLQAAKKGHTNAQLQSALILQNNKEHSKAIELLSKAAKKGHVDAQFLLASVYHSGKGVPQNYRLAYIWYSIAAANGDGDSEKMRDLISKQMDSETVLEAQNEAEKIFNSIGDNE